LGVRIPICPKLIFKNACGASNLFGGDKIGAGISGLLRANILLAGLCPLFSGQTTGKEENDYQKYWFIMLRTLAGHIGDARAQAGGIL